MTFLERYRHHRNVGYCIEWSWKAALAETYADMIVDHWSDEGINKFLIYISIVPALFFIYFIFTGSWIQLMLALLFLHIPARLFTPIPLPLREDQCPKCLGQCYRDSVDVGVGIIHGPYGCEECGWSEDSTYDLSTGRDPVDEKGGAIDQFGGYHPPGSPMALGYRLARSIEKGS